MTTPQPTEAALLGCSHPHSGAHLKTLRAMPEITRIHLWDHDPDDARRLAAESDAVVHENLDCLLSDSRIGWLLVAVRNDRFAELLEQTAAAGKPALCEKPLGRGYAEAARGVAAYRAAGLSLGIMFQNRYSAGAQQLRQWQREGLFGRLCSAECRLHTTQVALRNPRHWLFQQQLSGGGILPWLGCHWLDLLRYITGDEPVSVSAQVATLSGEAIDVEDMAAMSIRFADGAIASGSFGYLMGNGGPGYISPGYDSYFGFKGTAGHATWLPQSQPQTVQVWSRQPAFVSASSRSISFSEDPCPAYGGSGGLQFARDALLAAQTGCAAPATGEDLLAVWRMIEAAYESSRDGVTVTLR